MSELQNLYLQLLNNFPLRLRPYVSIILAILLVYSIFKIIKKDFVYLILLIVLLPGSVPILKNVWQTVLVFIKFLLNTK